MDRQKPSKQPTLDKEKIKLAYRENINLLRKSRAELNQVLREVIADIKDTNLVRARIVDTRIKDLDSVLKKLEKLQTKRGKQPFFHNPSLGLFDVDDLVGFRVVCNNIEDVYRFCELLTEKLQKKGAYVSTQDYIENPKEDGYRAIHINLSLDVETKKKLKKTQRISFEVQIRTLLHDSFARLSHKDIYKSDSQLPPDLKERMSDLADLLSLADGVASRLRERFSELRTRPKKKPSLAKLSKSALTYIFSYKFGKSPTNYLIQHSLNICKKIDVESLEKLPSMLNNKKLRGEIDRIYKDITGYVANHEQFFLASIYALVDKKKAYEYVKSDAISLKLKTDEQRRRVILANMPINYEEFKSKLTSDDLNVEEIAFALNSVIQCKWCDVDLIDAEDLQWAVSHFYKTDTIDGQVASTIYNGGYEIPDIDFPNMCPHCAYLYNVGDQ